MDEGHPPPEGKGSRTTTCKGRPACRASRLDGCPMGARGLVWDPWGIRLPRTLRPDGRGGEGRRCTALHLPGNARRKCGAIWCNDGHATTARCHRFCGGDYPNQRGGFKQDMQSRPQESQQLRGAASHELPGPRRPIKTERPGQQPGTHRYDGGDVSGANARHEGTISRGRRGGENCI